MYTHTHTNNMDQMGGEYWVSSKSYLRKIISSKEKLNTDEKNKTKRADRNIGNLDPLLIMTKQ